VFFTLTNQLQLGWKTSNGPKGNRPAVEPLNLDLRLRFVFCSSSLVLLLLLPSTSLSTACFFCLSFFSSWLLVFLVFGHGLGSCWAANALLAARRAGASVG
jgi:hypothetical protein